MTARSTRRVVSGWLLGMTAVLAWTGLVPGQETDKTDAGRLDLAKRYRFRERYAVGTDTPPAGSIGQYKVKLEGTLKSIRENPRGAPAREEQKIQATFRERPAELSSTDARRVTAAVRQYDSWSLKPNPMAKASGPRLFEDLLIWVRPRVEAAEILVLTPGRALSEAEYMFAAGQGFLPDLTFALPEFPIRLGEPWRLSRTAAAALMSPLPVDRSELTGKLVKLTPDDRDPARRSALLDIAGGVETGPVRSSLHARVYFSFAMPAAPARNTTASVGAVDADPPIDVTGEIVRLAMAVERTMPQPAPNDRLTVQVRHELVIDRNTADPGTILSVPNPAPTATVENSWLLYVDPKERFHLRHPQDFKPELPGEEDSVALLRGRLQQGEPADAINLALLPRSKLEPDKVRKGLFEGWKADKVDVTPGEFGPMPEADWPMRKVYHIEAALAPSAQSTQRTVRKYFFGYIVQTGRDKGLYVDAITVQSQTAPFRKQVEDIIRSFDFGPPSKEPK
jgi:hypothetical protein